MAAMVAAAIELLLERTPDEITIRDVAERSGHHHRFVASWFGGKAGLFRAAFDQMASAAAGALTLTVPDPGTAPTPATVRLVHLMNWLATHDPEAFAADRPTPLIDRIAEQYVERFGQDAELARLSAQRLLSIIVALTLFPGPLNVAPGDLDRHFLLEDEGAGRSVTRRRRSPRAGTT
jgi:AcrR family transcriptional regulator